MDKTKKRKLIIILSIAVLFLLCFVPIRLKLKDGGTVVYQAVLYKVIVWDRIGDDKDGPERIQGTDFYFFPFCYGEKEPRR